MIHAKEILNLLLSRHAEDVCVPECKDGSTWDRTHRRLDLWVLKRSWSPVTMIGYEIKVSRSDFLSDDKWPAYLSMCNQFYFVCPSKLISVEEVPATAGLLWMAATGSRVYIKKKAPRREIEVPANLLLYILITRATINKRGTGICDIDPVEFWENWVADKERKRGLAFHVSKKIREYVDRVDLENDRLKRGIAAFENVRARMLELGVDPDKSLSIYSIERQVRAKTALFPPYTREMIEKAYRAIGKVKELMGELEDQNG